jgi:mono/diheme cytochrome c family protein
VPATNAPAGDAGRQPRRLGRIVWPLAIIVLVGLTGAAAIGWRPAIPPATPPGGFDQASIARGAQLAAIGDCAICHTQEGGTPYAGGRPVQTPFGVIHASNITPDPETGIGTWSQDAFLRAMRNGVDRSGRFLYPAFPYNHFTHATTPDLQAIYAFLMTREPVHAATPPNHLPFPLNIRAVLAVWNLLYLRHGPIPLDPAHDAAWNRGHYLAESLGHCAACHSPHDLLGGEETGAAYAGGQAEGWNGPGLTAASSPAPLAWTEDQLVAFFRDGLADRHAASAGPMMPVSHDLSAVDPEDVRAIAVYIAGMAGSNDPSRVQRVTARVAAAQDAPDPHLASLPGAVVFAGACAGCHGPGAPMMLNGRPSLALGSSVAAADPRDAIQVVLHGLRPNDGQRGPWMPGFAPSLTDAQVADVLHYLRARFSDRPDWSGLADRVAAIRKEPGM